MIAVDHVKAYGSSLLTTASCVVLTDSFIALGEATSARVAVPPMREPVNLEFRPACCAEVTTVEWSVKLRIQVTSGISSL